MDLELQKKYDEICGTAFVNIYTLTKHCDCISIAPFNAKNPEHLFVLHLAKGVASIENKEVCVDTSKFQLWILNRKVDKECRFKKFNDKDIAYAINPNTLLDFMRSWASELMEEENFDFGQIYHEFYELKKGKKK